MKMGAKPAADSVIIIFFCGAVAEDTVLCPVAESFYNGVRNPEIHIGHPERKKFFSFRIAVSGSVFHGVTVFAVDFFI